MKSGSPVWRPASSIDEGKNWIDYSVCEMIPGKGYGDGYTSIGVITLRGLRENKTVLDEFDEVLRRIEILE